MVDKTVAEAPAPGSPEKPQVSIEGARGDWASPETRPAQKRVVYVDFGRNKIYTLTDDVDEVSVSNNLVELVERLKPKMVVVDSLPNKLQKTVAELVKTGIMFLRLRDLRKVAEVRKTNGIVKNDENDVKSLRQLLRQNPEYFQPLYTTPEELNVRSLTELWVQISLERKSAKHARTTADNPVAAEAHKTLQRLVKKIAKEIDEEALKLPLYRKAVEELGLRGPALAYIVSHDTYVLTVLPRDRLTVRYGLYDRPYRMPTRGRLLIAMANTTVLNKHPRYYGIYQKYVEKHSDKPRRRRHWKAVLQLSQRILRDIHKLAKANRCQTPDT